MATPTRLRIPCEQSNRRRMMEFGELHFRMWDEVLEPYTHMDRRPTVHPGEEMDFYKGHLTLPMATSLGKPYLEHEYMLALARWISLRIGSLQWFWKLNLPRPAPAYGYQGGNTSPIFVRGKWEGVSDRVLEAYPYVDEYGWREIKASILYVGAEPKTHLEVIAMYGREEAGRMIEAHTSLVHAANYALRMELHQLDERWKAHP